MRRGHPPSGDDAEPLRKRAEERLRAREAATALRPGDEADALRLLHELEVHQIELELQNAELERTRDELEAALERYTDLYDFAPVGYLTLARDGGIYSANLAGADLLGVPRARLLGRRFGTFLPLAERPAFDSFLARTLDDSQRESCEVTLVPDGGGRRVVRIEATASPSGKECRAALLDVTAQRAAEAEVRRVNEGLAGTVTQRTSELEEANAELEAFVQSVSHDLRAPVRVVSGLSQILEEDFGDHLPPAAAGHLRRIHEGARRMGALIDDLLRLSRIGKTELEVTTVDLAGPCREIMDELAAGSPDRRVETAVAESIPVRGDARLLRVMLQNLLENAWKFTAAETVARIEVSSRLGTDGQRETDFSDNGAGFDMTLAGKLFAPFHRLHSADQFAGTGIGLALVDRIVRRHGGSIRAESVEGSGAVFSVRLPAPRADGR